MKLSDLEYICDSVANVSDIPIRLFNEHEFDAAFHMHHLHPDPFAIYKDLLLSRTDNISYYITPYLQYYGIINHKKFTMVLGPVGHCNLNKQEEHDYSFLLGISHQQFKLLLQDMNTIPLIPLENFLYILLLLNFYLNDEKLDLSALPLYDQLKSFHTETVSKAETDVIELDSKSEAKPYHNSLEYERQMLEYVTSGDVDGLASFLFSIAHGGVGKVAAHYLRQLKNIFVTVVTLVSRASISGGLSEEEAMSLSDYYIQYCEEMYDTEAISALQYHMVMDFTNRVSKGKNCASASPLIKDVISYIKRNLSVNINTNNIANHAHISRSALSTRFKKETGVTLADFVQNERLVKAKSLLQFTEKSLSEISAFLCFSSQSHFQTVFKKAYGLTPNEYRKSKKE